MNKQEVDLDPEVDAGSKKRMLKVAERSSTGVLPYGDP